MITSKPYSAIFKAAFFPKPLLPPVTKAIFVVSIFYDFFLMVQS
jgi:hypothetical protein